MSELYLREINSECDNDMSILNNFMKIDFPRTERIPHRLIKKAMQNNIMKSFFLTDDTADYGYIVIQPLKNSKVIYVHYLAIFTNMRDCGYGSMLLKLISQMYPDNTILLEVEDAEKAPDPIEQAIREKRISFYERNGLEIIDGVDLNLFGIPMKYMANGDIKTKDYNKFVKKVYMDVTGNFLVTIPISATTK